MRVYLRTFDGDSDFLSGKRVAVLELQLGLLHEHLPLHCSERLRRYDQRCHRPL